MVEIEGSNEKNRPVQTLHFKGITFNIAWKAMDDNEEAAFFDIFKRIAGATHKAMRDNQGGSSYGHLQQSDEQP